MTSIYTPKISELTSNHIASVFRLFLPLLITALFHFHALSQDPTLVWAKQIGGSLTDQSRSITLDQAGSIISTGYFQDTVDFNPGADENILISAGGLDIYVSKLDRHGNFLWAKQMGGPSTDIAYSVILDSSGNIYTTGWFAGTADFDPGAGSELLTSAGGNDIFVSKLDSSGNFAWAKRLGGSGADRSYSIILTPAEHVLTSGSFEQTADFDPGTNTYNLTSSGEEDIFISHLDEEGKFISAGKLGGAGSEEGLSLNIEPSGNVYTTGYFQGVADFDPGSGVFNLMSAGSYDVFVCKTDAAGNFVWAKKMGGASADQGHFTTMDADGNLFITGNFNGTADFDPGTGVFYLSSAGNADIFLIKLDASGNFQWAKNMGGGGSDFGYSVSLDIHGSIYTTGYFNGTADFNPGIGVFNLVSSGSRDVFVSKLDTNANFIWAVKLGGNSIDWGQSIALVKNGNVYITGYFQGTADFDPGQATTNLSAIGNYDVFLVKLGQPNLLPLDLLSFSAGLNGKVVDLHWVTASETNNDYFNVERSADGIYWETVTTADGAGNSAIELHYASSDLKPFSGVSYYRLKQTDFDGHYSYSDMEAIHLLQAEDLIIYPNPVINQFTLDLGREHTDVLVEVKNSLGQIVFSARYETLISTTIEIDAPQGLYFVHVLSDKGLNMVAKVVKQHLR